MPQQFKLVHAKQLSSRNVNDVDNDALWRCALCLTARTDTMQYSTIRHLKQREIRPYLHRKPKENRKEEPTAKKKRKKEKKNKNNINEN